jgi:hypothetical protein
MIPYLLLDSFIRPSSIITKGTVLTTDVLFRWQSISNFQARNYTNCIQVQRKRSRYYIHTTICVSSVWFNETISVLAKTYIHNHSVVSVIDYAQTVSRAPSRMGYDRRAVMVVFNFLLSFKPESVGESLHPSLLSPLNTRICLTLQVYPNRLQVCLLGSTNCK